MSENSVCTGTRCFLISWKTSVKMRSAQTHRCAWAIMKKFIYFGFVRLINSVP